MFLDRDGTINRAIVRDGKPYPPASLDEFRLLPRALEAIQALKQAGLQVIVVTNQPDVATGTQKREVVEAIHAYVRECVPVDDIKVCYHVDHDQCACRKPKPGMLLQAAEERRLDLNVSFMVGDRWRDIEAGRAAGCRTILVGEGYAEKPAQDPDFIAPSLWEASRMILSVSA